MAVFAQDAVLPADKFPLRSGIPCHAANDQPRGRYRSRLNSSQERRAKAIYRRAIIATAHDHCHEPEDFRAAADAGITVRTIKPLTDGYYRQGAERFPIEEPVLGWEARGRAAIEMLRRTAEQSRGSIRIIEDISEIAKVKRAKAQGIVLSFEGGRPLEGKVENVALFHSLGLRELQLHWAVPSPLRAANGDLTWFGEAVVREANRLGLLIDISHMPARSFHRVLEISSQPVIVSHCGVAFVEQSKHPRTDRLDDDTIRRIGSARGVLALHFLNGYVQARRRAHATVEDLVDEIDHIKKVAGIDVIALGPDYSPMQGWRWIEGGETYAGMPNVVREMVFRGYTDGDIEKVLGGNLVRLYSAVWKQ